MRRVVPVLLGAFALLTAGGTWMDNAPAHTKARDMSAFPRTLKPRTVEVQMPKEAPQAFLGGIEPGMLSHQSGPPVPTVMVPGLNPSDTLRWHNDTNSGGIGLTSGGTFEGAARFTPTTGCTLTHIRWYCYGVPSWASIIIYGPGSASQPGAVLDSFGATPSSTGWQWVAMPTSRRLPSGQDFWVSVMVNHSGTVYPLGRDRGPQVRERGGFVRFSGGSWGELYGYGLDYNWNISAIVEPEAAPDSDMAVVGIDAPEMMQPNRWVTISATVQNLGLDTMPPGIPVGLHIIGPGGYNYYDTAATTDTLLFGETEDITFSPNWYTPTTTGIYYVNVWTELSGDQNPDNDTLVAPVDVTWWIMYAGWTARQYYTRQPIERGTMFFPNDFSLNYPIRVESLKAAFSLSPSLPWADSTIIFKIYAGDLYTVLYEDTVEVLPGDNVLYVADTVVLDSSFFGFTLRPLRFDSGPTSWADADPDARSIYGDPDSGWYYWTPGEFHTAAFVTFEGVTDDVGFYDIDVPLGHVEPGDSVTPTGWVRNYGVAYQGAVPCSCIIVDNATDAVIYRTGTTVSVTAGDTAMATFPGWAVPDSAQPFRAYMFTYLSGDENPGNDGVTTLFMGFPVEDELLCPALWQGVTVDGALGSTEWSDAARYDVSNIYGWIDPLYRWFPGNVYLSLKHDDDYVYLGFDMPYTTSYEWTELGLYFDEDDDGAWAGDSSEGNYWYDTDSDSVQYRSLPSGFRDALVEAAMAGYSMSSGHLQMELALPIGTAIEAMNINPAADTLGFWLYDYYPTYNEWPGYWQTMMNESNWYYPSFYGDVIVTGQLGNPDAGVLEITAPTGFNDTNAVIAPRVVVRNYGDTELSFDAWFVIDDGTDAEVYRQSETVLALAVGEDRAVDFAEWAKPHPAGVYTTRCSLALADIEPGNDQATGIFSIGIRPAWPTGWTEVVSMPLAPSGRPAKRGAWAALHDADGKIYLAKGYKTTDFYRYDPLTEIWELLSPMPYQTHPLWSRKVPRKGSKGVSDGERYVYVTQGNNSLGFWRYDVETDSWAIMPDVPLGMFRKKVKGGTDMVYVPGRHDSSYVYLLKGYKTEFYRFRVADTTWETLDPAPYTGRNKWDKGSWLAYQHRGRGHGGQERLIFAHQAKYHGFFTFDLDSVKWDTTPMAPMPFIGMMGRRKKSKDGGSGDFYDDQIYALKGGNTQEFWKYDPHDSISSYPWVELETIPAYGSTGRKKRVKYGADLVHWADGAFFTLKGNKTVEMWRYTLPLAYGPSPARSGVMAEAVDARKPGVDIAPNPLVQGRATLRYALPKAGPVQIQVFDVSGRSVSSHALLAGRSGAVSLDLRELSAGIYLVRLDADGFSSTRKLVVQH